MGEQVFCFVFVLFFTVQINLCILTTNVTYSFITNFISEHTFRFECSFLTLQLGCGVFHASPFSPYFPPLKHTTLCCVVKGLSVLQSSDNYSVFLGHQST